MKALSVRNPWATLIERGQKTVELRSKRTRHRGPLLIVSTGRANMRLLRSFGFEKADVGMGQALCIVDVVECRVATPDDVGPACVAPPEGSYAWVFANARPVQRFPLKGQLSMFDVEDSLLFKA
jgi:hypothetical protein